MTDTTPLLSHLLTIYRHDMKDGAASEAPLPISLGLMAGELEGYVYHLGGRMGSRQAAALLYSWWKALHVQGSFKDGSMGRQAETS